MTFAQALARIKWLCTPGNRTHPELYLDDYNECRDLLLDHADSIVQLAKVAAKFNDATDNVFGYRRLNDVRDAREAYYKLMKGDE